MPRRDPPTNPRTTFSGQGWTRKFSNAFRGLKEGILDSNPGGGPRRWQQNSFLVHAPVAVLVVLAAWYRGIDGLALAVLLICIGSVLVAELFNSAIECLSRAITDQPNPDIRLALDIASGAVLLASLFAAATGLLILLTTSPATN